MKRVVMVCLLTVVCMAMCSTKVQAEGVYYVPAHKDTHCMAFVEGVLPETASKVNEKARSLYEETGIDIRYVILPAAEYRDMYRWAATIAREWEKNATSAIVLFTESDLRIGYWKGERLDTTLPTGILSQWIYDDTEKMLAGGDLNAALMSLSEQIANYLMLKHEDSVSPVPNYKALFPALFAVILILVVVQDLLCKIPADMRPDDYGDMNISIGKNVRLTSEEIGSLIKGAELGKTAYQVEVEYWMYASPQNYVVFVDFKPVGVAYAKRDMRLQGEIFRAVVHKMYSKCGVSEMLVEAVAKDNNHYLYVEFLTENSGEREFFERKGYRVV